MTKYLRISRRRGAYPPELTLRVEVDREVDGQWIYDVVDLPGVISYGATQQEARANVAMLALRVIDERFEHGEDVPDLDPVDAPEATHHTTYHA